MSRREHTVELLGETVTNAVDATYRLVYAEQGQGLPADVVAALVKGENPWETVGGDNLSAWESDVRWSAACDTVDDLAREIVRHWEREGDHDYDELLDHAWPSSLERLSAIETVLERDESEWFRDLVKRSGAVLLRVTIPSMDEDAGLSSTDITPDAFLDLLGCEQTDENRRNAGEVIDNASPEFSVAIGQALIGVDLADLVCLPDDGLVELRNPHVWLGNPFAGSGWCSEEAFAATLTVDRDALRTDEDAFGYSWGEVVGGTSPSYFAGAIVAVAKQSV
jgi:hypothetical protein